MLVLVVGLRRWEVSLIESSLPEEGVLTLHEEVRAGSSSSETQRPSESTKEFSLNFSHEVFDRVESLLSASEVRVLSIEAVVESLACLIKKAKRTHEERWWRACLLDLLSVILINLVLVRPDVKVGFSIATFA